VDADGTFSFDGRYYRLEGSPPLPKRVQRPHPPVIVGGGGKTRTPDLAARWADEFNLPFASSGDTAAQFDRVRAACASTGRQLVLSAAQTVVCGRDDAEVRPRAAAIGRGTEPEPRSVVSSLDALADQLRPFVDAGAARLYLQVLDLTDLAHLEVLAGLAARV
jgi:alkanesulfonate monooxygenase SsuD/methylene tetrahydromethanopterin reductase-like flavin-dependent oxidoreductase (luciferase family)